MQLLLFLNKLYFNVVWGLYLYNILTCTYHSASTFILIRIQIKGRLINENNN